MKQNICELDTMIFFREALAAHEFLLLPVMASAVVECRTAVSYTHLMCIRDRFDSVNQQVADISVQVGQTPQGWNGLSLIHI